MKKIMLIVSVVVLMFVLAGCGKTAGQAIKVADGDTFMLKESVSGKSLCINSQPDVKFSQRVAPCHFYTASIMKDNNWGYSFEIQENGELWLRANYYVAPGGPTGDGGISGPQYKSNVGDASKEVILCAKKDGSGHPTFCKSSSIASGEWTASIELKESSLPDSSQINFIDIDSVICGKGYSLCKRFWNNDCVTSKGAGCWDYKTPPVSFKAITYAGKELKKVDLVPKEGDSCTKDGQIINLDNTVLVCAEGKLYDAANIDFLGDLSVPPPPTFDDNGCVVDWHYEKADGSVSGPHKGCITENDDKPWCATKTTYKNDKHTYVSGSKEGTAWKYCPVAILPDLSTDINQQSVGTVAVPDGAVVPDTGETLPVVGSLTDYRPQKNDDGCLQDWVYMKSNGAVASAPESCTWKDTTQTSKWCATNTIPVYFTGQKQGTEFKYCVNKDGEVDLTGCVKNFYYSWDGKLTGPYSGCTMENDNKLWCATKVANVYVQGDGKDTTSKVCGETTSTVAGDGCTPGETKTLRGGVQQTCVAVWQ